VGCDMTFSVTDLYGLMRIRTRPNHNFR
jgi:hypothetical protein